MMLVTFFVWPSDARTQEVTPEAHPFHAGAWAIQFRIGDNFTLSTFQGSVLSVQRHSSRRSAWRFGLGMNGDWRDSDIEITLTRNDTLLDDQTRGNTNKSGSIEVDVQYIHYPSPESRVKLFLGGGPLFDVSRRTHQQASPNAYASDESTGLDAGVSGVLGVVWFFSRSLCLHAEYGLRFTYLWRSSKYEIVSPGERSTQDSSTNGISFGGRGALFGLSAYF